MPVSAEVGGDVASSAAALAGLLLVYLGAIIVSFDGYQATERNTVKARYRRRGWLGFAGFVFAILATPLGLAGKGFQQESLVLASMACILVAVGISLIVAWFTVVEVR
jgi:hypothetical protein